MQTLKLNYFLQFRSFAAPNFLLLKKNDIPNGKQQIQKKRNGTKKINRHKSEIIYII